MTSTRRPRAPWRHRRSVHFAEPLAVPITSTTGSPGSMTPDFRSLSWEWSTLNPPQIPAPLEPMPDFGLPFTVHGAPQPQPHPAQPPQARAAQAQPHPPQAQVTPQGQSQDFLITEYFCPFCHYRAGRGQMNGYFRCPVCHNTFYVHPYYGAIPPAWTGQVPAPAPAPAPNAPQTQAQQQAPAADGGSSGTQIPPYWWARPPQPAQQQPAPRRSRSSRPNKDDGSTIPEGLSPHLKSDLDFDIMNPFNAPSVHVYDLPAHYPYKSEIYFVHDALYWDIHVTVPPNSGRNYLTIADVLSQIHRNLQRPVTDAEFLSLGLPQPLRWDVEYRFRERVEGDPAAQRRGYIRADFLRGYTKLKAMRVINDTTWTFSVLPWND